MAACLLALALHELPDDELHGWLSSKTCRFWIDVSGLQRVVFMRQAEDFILHREEYTLVGDVE